MIETALAVIICIVCTTMYVIVLKRTGLGVQAPSKELISIRDKSTNIIFQDPVWRQTGRELQVLADAFGRSPGRLLVRQRAEQVDVRTLDMEKFWSLLKALFEVNNTYLLTSG